MVKMLHQSGRLPAVQKLYLNNTCVNEEILENIVVQTPGVKDVRFYNMSVTEKVTQTLVTSCPKLEVVRIQKI